MDFLTTYLEKDRYLREPGGGGPSKKPTVFIAYRMSSNASRKFRSELELLLDDCTIKDGHVGPGVDWAPEVRRRIKNSKLLVADLSGPSREVLFELGFAGNKDMIPVALDQAAWATLPRWITSKQVQEYASGGIHNIAESVRLRVQSQRRVRNRPPPVPGQLAFITRRGGGWFDSTRARIELLCNEYETDFFEYLEEDLQSPEDLRAALRASIIVGVIDGLQQDYVVHYLLGDIVRRSPAGAGSKEGQGLKRVGIALLETRASEQYVADSLRRVSSSQIADVTPEEIDRPLRQALERYRRLRLGS